MAATSNGANVELSMLEPDKERAQSGKKYSGNVLKVLTDTILTDTQVAWMYNNGGMFDGEGN